MVRSSKRVKKVKIEDLNTARLATQVEPQDSIEELLEEPSQPMTENVEPPQESATAGSASPAVKSPKRKSGGLKVDRLVLITFVSE